MFDYAGGGIPVKTTHCTHTTNEQRVRAGAGQASVCTDSEWCTPDSRREGGGDAANANAPAEPSQGQCHTQTQESKRWKREGRGTPISRLARRELHLPLHMRMHLHRRRRAHAATKLGRCVRAAMGWCVRSAARSAGLTSGRSPARCSRSRKNRRGASASTTSYR